MSEQTDTQNTVITQQPDYSDTTRYKTLANGAIMSLETKRIVANPGGGKSAITSANASEYQRLRFAKYQQAVQDAIVDGTKVKPGDVFAGIRTLARAQVAIANDKRQGRASTEAYKTLVAHAGLIADKHDTDTTGIDVHIDAAAICELLQLVAERKRQLDSEHD
jgi:hypothetical protein